MGKSKRKAHRRRSVVNDPALPLLNGIELVAPLPFKPLSPARQRAWQRDKAAWLAAERERSRARAQEHAGRLARRPASMQGRYRLPPDVAAFLTRLFHVWRMDYALVEQPGKAPVSADAVSDLIEAAYMEGCRQGYIEGFVVRREPDRTRSIKGNAGKRKAPVPVGDRTMPRDQRDAEMVAEYGRLLQLPMKHTPACQRLAERYGFESWQGVAGAIKRFCERAGR